MEALMQWLGHAAIAGGACSIIISTIYNKKGEYGRATYHLLLGIWATYVGLL